MRISAVLLLLALMEGCTWPVAMSPRHPPPHPSARGSWRGVTEPAALHDPSGKAHDAVVLRVTAGPRMRVEDGSEYPMPADAKPVLLDEKGRVLQPPGVRPGQAIEVSGTMLAEVPAHLPNVGVVSAKPGNSLVFGIKVEGSPKVLP